MSAEESTVLTVEEAASGAENGTETPTPPKPTRTRRRTPKQVEPNGEASPSDDAPASDASASASTDAASPPAKRTRRRKAAPADDPLAPSTSPSPAESLDNSQPHAAPMTAGQGESATTAALEQSENTSDQSGSADTHQPMELERQQREGTLRAREDSRGTGQGRTNHRDRQRQDRNDHRQDSRQGRRDNQQRGQNRERFNSSRNGPRSVAADQRGMAGQYSNQSYVQPNSATNPDHIGVSDLNAKSLDELYEVATKFEVPGHTRIKRPELTIRILKAQSEAEGDVFGDGVLEIIEDGFGFLRGQRFLPSADDIYVSQSQIRRFALRTGDRVSGQVRPPKDSEKFFSLLRVEAVNGVDPEVARRRPSFDSLTPIFPLERIDLETTPNVLSTRLLDLVAPVGRGQRGLIVSPPKAGKTMLLKSIANGITANSPDMHLMVCLIGERPEEVTDMRRSIDGEVISSTFDEPVEDHAKVAEMALERAKRLVEAGNDVTILLDSITRLARAYNLAVPPSGRTLSGGMDPVALYPPKRFFGAARNIEGGGSLTVVATCLIDTGSRMDDLIYEEFKGTGNMELHLDRKLAERRIYPSIDIQRSGTRREELLLDDHALRQVWTMRRMVSMLGGSEGTELVLSRLGKTQTNKDFLETLNRDV